ncbi:MAG: hypothetical protein ACOCY7_00800 [Halodesulfurarchaeum sp.]
MPMEGERPCTQAEYIQTVGWTAAQALLRAQSEGYRAMEDYLLLTYYDRMDQLEEPEIQHVLTDAIDAHREIIEELECALDALDRLQKNQ